MYIRILVSLVAQMVKNLLQCERPGFDPWVRKIPWRRAWQPPLVFLPGESPWTEDPGGLLSMALKRVGHNWATKHSTHICIYIYVFMCVYIYCLATPVGLRDLSSLTRDWTLSSWKRGVHWTVREVLCSHILVLGFFLCKNVESV